MEVNHKQPLRSHHSPCLSGSSQAPLLPPTYGDMASERSTPISARSLPFHSPTNHNNINDNSSKHQQQVHHHHQHYQQQQLVSTPNTMPCHSAASVHSQTSVFFPPPLPARQSINARHKPQKIFIESSNKSPRLTNDINMNCEHERNRELQNSNSMSPLSQQSATRFGPSTSNLNSPANQFAFFPEPHLFAQHQSRRTSSGNGQQASFNSTTNDNHSPIIDLANSINSINNNQTGSWSQQDDSYHLYHEPVDPDESSPMPSASMVTKVMTPETSHNVLPRSADRLEHSSFPQRLNSSAFGSTNGQASNQDWPSVTLLPISSTNKSPTISCNDSSNTMSRPSYTESAPIEPSRDVSADIYFCYVTLKSKRANHRSRSYHGPKNANASDQKQQLPYFKDAVKNLSSTSVAELPISPIASPSSVLPLPFDNHCLRELLETESNYVHALEMIITSFAKPLECYLKKEENQLIFGHIKYFHHIHSAFQVDLIKAAFALHNNDLSDRSKSARNTLANSSQSAKQTSSNPTTPTALNNIPQQFMKNSPLSSPKDNSSSNFSKHYFGNSLRISTCFLNIKDKLLKYGEYCASLSKAQALLDELTNKSDLSAHLDRCQQDANEGKFKLRDLLSLPMQRILKYHLLLAQLIKKTDASNDDYQGLKRAYDMMLDLGHYINEVKRDTEATQIINEIEQSITGLNMPLNTQLTDYGRLVTDGFIRIKAPHDLKQHDGKLKLPHDTKLKQKRYVFVFDKVMLMCKLSGVRGYQYKEALVLSEFELEVSPIISANEAKLTVREKWSYNFNLTRSCDKTTYCFYAKTIEDKKRWIEAIQQAMDNVRPAACRNKETNHEFLMHTFDKASSCDHCGKLLLGLYYQGYRCRSCFCSVHKKCIASVRPCGPTLPPKPPLNPSSQLIFELDNNQNKDIAHLDGGECYANFTLEGEPWYWGRMERDQAQARLENTQHGTFLVRVSPKHKGSYVISLNYNSHVKHMRINVSKDNQLYLSHNRYFKSIIELVSWYQENSLIESFHMLDARLAIPYKSD